jgi:pilus assembly protein CpaE
MTPAAPVPTQAPAAPLLALVQDEPTRDCVRQAVLQLGWPADAVRPGGVAEASALLAGSPPPDLLLVDVSAAADAAAAMDALAEVCAPQTRVVAIGAVNDVALYRRLIHMGVSDYLVKPTTPELVADAVQRAVQVGPAAPAPGAAKTARVVALIGARGGVGTTTVATSTSWALAQEQRQRTVLVDLDLQFGSVALSLDIEPGRGLREILSSPERIDSLLIGSASRQQGERLRVLGAEEPLEADIELGGEGLLALLDCLREGADVIVIDTPRRLDGLSRAALAHADIVGVVTDLTLPGLRDTQRLLKALGGLRSEGEVLVVANRAGGVAGEVPQSEFERGIGVKLDVIAPFDPKAAAAAAEQGKPLLAAAPSGLAAPELRRLAGRISGEAAPAPQTSWLSRFLGR